MHITTLEALVAIILGTGGIGRGGWGLVRGILARAAAIEGFRADTRETQAKLVDVVGKLAAIAVDHDEQLAGVSRRLDDHDRQLDQLKEDRCATPNLPPPVNTRSP